MEQVFKVRIPESYKIGDSAEPVVFQPYADFLIFVASKDKTVSEMKDLVASEMKYLGDSVVLGNEPSVDKLTDVLGPMIEIAGSENGRDVQLLLASLFLEMPDFKFNSVIIKLDPINPGAEPNDLNQAPFKVDYIRFDILEKSTSRRRVVRFAPGESREGAPIRHQLNVIELQERIHQIF